MRTDCSPIATAVLVVVGVTGAHGSTLPAASCAVPGSYASIEAALADPMCTEVALEAGTFVAGLVRVDRDVALRGSASATTIVEGGFRVEGATTRASLEGVTIDATASSVAGCVREALEVDGGQVLTLDVVARSTDESPGPGAFCYVFSDGFESGNVASWTSQPP